MYSSENKTIPEDGSPDSSDFVFSDRGCCCFLGPWSRRRTSTSTSADWWERIRVADGENGWWARALLKIREWSEVVAGPRWKTFIRRFNKNPRQIGGSTRLGGRFQYDPLSYALNFDEGHGGGGASDTDVGFRDFSSRYAAPPLSAKSSMDLGGKDAPPLFAAVPLVPAITAVVR